MKKMTVLFIDDDKFLCEFVRIVLRSRGIKVDCAHDGEEGIKRFESFEYCAVVVDQMMPGINGFQVIETISSKGGQVPVIMLSGSGKKEDKDRAIEAGAFCYLEKGYDSEFIRKLQLILEKSHIQSVF